MSIHGLKLALRRQNITFSLFLTHFISISAQALKLNELTTARPRERCQTKGLMSHAMAAYVHYNSLYTCRPLQNENYQSFRSRVCRT